MTICECTLILSGFLFCIGLLGLLRQPSIVKVIISIEIMIFAGIINFAVTTGDFPIRSGHFAILIAVVLGGLAIGVIFTICNSQTRENKDINLLDEDDRLPLKPSESELTGVAMERPLDIGESTGLTQQADYGSSSKPPESGLLLEDTERRSGVYIEVHEHSSTGSTPQETDYGLQFKPSESGLLLEDTERRSGVYIEVHEHSSTGSTQQETDYGVFGRESNDG
ncbi:MAG: NADH-quinone oxidoreductase subunit K [Holosporales bacterium]|jgi:NADH:ubiquinone oxidoreductase subunit K|nr:NADH-quinone oxidoreductase subunit K [Holosporales bacterium]